MYKSLLTVILFTSGIISANAQSDSLTAMLDKDNVAPKKEPVSYTFKATRIVNGSSVENLGAGVLDFRISHRFGRLSEGSSNFFGLDDATTRIGLDYGITKWLMVGIGHNTLNKDDDGFLKLKLLRQYKHGMPVTVSFVSSLSVQTSTPPVLPTGDTWLFSNKLSYVNQLLIARKCTDWLSLQIMPTIVHYNLVDSSKFSNNTIALGIGGRIKISRRVAITGEYYYRLNNTDLLFQGQPTYNSLSVGVDIETGGHVFQLMLTNAPGVDERTFIGETTDSWAKGNLHFGFNISRVFTVVKPKEFR
jgi:Membrane bound beta barrel domain (DUF5777)